MFPKPNDTNQFFIPPSNRKSVEFDVHLNVFYDETVEVLNKAHFIYFFVFAFSTLAVPALMPLLNS
jgi:hypothetical protein